MKFVTGFTDPFLSPVTGLLARVQPLPDLEFGFVWMGDRDNRPLATPKLTDLNIDVKTLQWQIAESDFNLAHNKIWLGNASNKAKPVSTLLVENLPVLGAALFPYPSGSPLPAVPIPNPTFNPTSGSDWIMSGPWLSQVFAGSPNTLNTESTTAISSTLAMTQFQVAQALKRLDNATFIVKSKALTFAWDNPAMGLVPQSIRTLYGLDPAYTFPQAIALDELGQGLLWNGENGTLGMAPLRQNYIWVGNAENKPEERLYAPNTDTYFLLKRRVDEHNPDELNLFPHAQYIKDTIEEDRLIKTGAEGALEAAVEDVDYASVASVEHAQATADTAQTTAEAAQVTADTAVGLAEAAQATADTAVGMAGTALAGVATLALEKESKADHEADMKAVNQKIDGIQGTARQIQVSHAGAITVSMADNPVIPGVQALTLPVGQTTARPTVLTEGMIRFNPDL